MWDLVVAAADTRAALVGVDRMAGREGEVAVGRMGRAEVADPVVEGEEVIRVAVGRRVDLRADRPAVERRGAVGVVDTIECAG